MFINRWMDKEAVVHIHNGILFSHKKEQIWVSSREVNEPTACYAECSKSERKKQTLYINAYIWVLEKWCWCAPYVLRCSAMSIFFFLWLHGMEPTRILCIYAEDKLVDTVGEGEGGTNWERSIETYTLPYVKKIASGNLLYDIRSSTQCSVIS